MPRDAPVLGMFAQVGMCKKGVAPLTHKSRDCLHLSDVCRFCARKGLPLSCRSLGAKGATPRCHATEPEGQRPSGSAGFSARRKMGQAPQCGAFRQVPPAKTTVVGASGPPERLNNNMGECPTGQTSEIRRGFRAFSGGAPTSAPPARLLPSFLRGRSAQTPPKADLQHVIASFGRHLKPIV